MVWPLHLLDNPGTLKHALVTVLLLTGILIAKNGRSQSMNPTISIFQFHEFRVKARTVPKNPFLEASLSGRFKSSTGKIIDLQGFYDGDNTWKLRFAPTETGIWTYELSGHGLEYAKKGKLNCINTPGPLQGFIGIHPKYPYAFASSNGSAFFPMGDTSYGLFDDSPVTTELRKAYIDQRRKDGFNFIRMEIGHSHLRAGKDNAYWAWGGTVNEPDMDRFNPAFFKMFDRLLIQMASKGMNVELILLNFYRQPFINSGLWTAKREQQWLSYLLARYAAFNNVFMWTISNEYETHPNGAYHLDVPGDVDWAIQTGKFIKDKDPYHHPVTVHPVISSSTSANSPRDPFEQPWRIGGFFGQASGIDVLSQQTGQGGTGTHYDEACACIRGDDQNLTASIKADRIYGKPVINTENGYEYLRGTPTMKGQVHHTDKVRHSSWRIVCSGGYFSAGFSGTLAHSDIWNQIDDPNRYTFVLKDEGAARQLSFLYRFFTALPYWKMQPDENISGGALAFAGSGYAVLYFPQGGKSRYLRKSGGRNWALKWFNPRTGVFSRAFRIKPGENPEFKTPDDLDWVLLIKKM